MTEIDPISGLPKELNISEVLNRETTTNRIKIYTEKAKFKKLMTVISGIAGDELGKVTKELKSALSCGGTSKDGMIRLQGDHKEEVRKALEKMGYPKENIDVV
ncbi:MAG: stress response translation initiation inhibitor YciH [Candidatus Micrarchaeaceae archaeon]